MTHTHTLTQKVMVGMENGVPLEKRSGYVQVAFFGTSDRATLKDTQLRLYKDLKGEFADTKK